jgi:hypothetical protein
MNELFILCGAAVFIGTRTAARTAIDYYVAVSLRNDDIGKSMMILNTNQYLYQNKQNAVYKFFYTTKKIKNLKCKYSKIFYF